MLRPGGGTKACTLEAKLCPDGSAVGRTGPNCEFAPCPSVTPTSSEKPGDDQVVCTLEARQCPDGSYVSRTGPNCEFTPCPGATDTTNWKTYSNAKYSFSLKYPNSWGKMECSGTALPADTLIIGPEFANNPSVLCNTDITPTTSFYLRDKREALPQNFVISSQENTQIGGKNAVKYIITQTQPAPGPNKYIEYIIPLGSKFLVGTINNLNYQSAFDQILTTFKFTN